MQELKTQGLLPLGYDFAQGKYRKYVYSKERYQKHKQEIAESRGEHCRWCGKRQVDRYRTVAGYHTKCWVQKQKVRG